MVKDGTIDKAAAEAAKKPIRDFIQNHIRNRKTGLLLDSATFKTQDEAATPSQALKWGLEVVTGGTTSQEAVASAIQRINQEMARILGVEHLLLGSDGTGSLALSETKAQGFYLVVNSTNEDLGEVMEKDWLKPIWDLNGWDPALMPALRPETIMDQDIDKVMAAIRDIAVAGAPIQHGDKAVDELFGMLGLTPPDRLENPPLGLVGPDGAPLNPLGGFPPPKQAPAAGGKEPKDKLPAQEGQDK
jgi:hypothetical protein